MFKSGLIKALSLPELKGGSTDQGVQNSANLVSRKEEQFEVRDYEI